MTLIIPPNCAQELWVFTFPGTTVRATCSMAIQAPDGAEPAGTMTRMVQAWEDNLRDITSTNCTLDSVELIAAEFSFTQPVGLAGTATSFDINAYEGVVVHKQSDRRGRAHAGRMYWPGLLSPANIGTGGGINPDTVAALQAPFDAFLTVLQAEGTVDQVILHTQAGLAPDPIRNLVVKNRVGIQRRRRQKLT